MTSKVTPNSRPVHPCYLSVWEGNCGCEYSTWARISPTSTNKLPNLVTAQSSTLRIYSIEESTGKLLLLHSFSNLAGSVCFLDTLCVDDDDEADSLLVGFSGHPRLAVVSVQQVPTSSIAPAPELLMATSLLDLAPALTENSFGSITSLEQDLVASVSQKKNVATICMILGGGVSVACVTLHHHTHAANSTGVAGWLASEPYILPLHTLSRSLKLGDTSKGGVGGSSSAASLAVKDLTQSMCTGFGDILDTTFLPGYVEPTIVLLHANPEHGRTWSGRLGRPNASSGTRYGLVVTAISVTVNHLRSAVLWSVEVPADAMALHSVGRDKCLVQCANSLVSIGSSGQIQQCLAVNGWVRSTLTSDLLDKVQPNPWPFPKLAIQLDGAKLAIANDKTGFIALRNGQLYLLQHSNSWWCLLPLHQTIGATGQVANLLCLRFGEIPRTLYHTMVDKKKSFEGMDDSSMELGLVFVGSRLGDSSLLGYGLESTSVADAIKQEESLRKEVCEATDVKEKLESQVDNDDYETILRLEEEALYAPTENESNTGAHVIPASSDEEEMYFQRELSDGNPNARKRARMSQLVVVRSLTVIDSLTALGPLGPGCEGPVAPSPHAASSDTNKTQPLGSSGFVFPCGYGSSGGLALLTVPGRDDRSVIAEEDCINAEAIFNLPGRGLVMLSMAPDNGGTKFLQLEVENTIGEEHLSHTLSEVEMDNWCASDPRDLLATSTVLGAIELDDENFLLALTTQVDEVTSSFSFVALGESNGRLQIKFETPLNIDGTTLRTLTPFVRQSSDVMAMACTLSSGDVVLATVNTVGNISTFVLKATTPMDIEEETLSEEAEFYRSGAIVAVDIFNAPKALFVSNSARSSTVPATANGSQSNATTGIEDAGYIFDEDDMELYGEAADGNRSSPSKTTRLQEETADSTVETFLGVCRQSGELEVYVLSELMSSKEESPVWSSRGCGHGLSRLTSQQNVVANFRLPRMHKIHTSEMRFFFCGPSGAEWSGSIGGPRPFLLVVETNEGDTLLYSAEVKPESKLLDCFRRIPLKVVTRPSQEQARHFAKLRRKRIVGNKEEFDARDCFRHNRMHPFNNISGQDGLFAAVARPLWIVSERGKPTILSHRSRHVAPAGARPRPIAGFCSGVLTKMDSGASGFITLHDRVGRVGTQRMTVFNGIWDPSTSHSLIPGGGLFVEKIPFGVTVRRIQFIDDPNTSTGAHPLYAVLVSREIEDDHGVLNSDGLSSEERQRLREEKENAKIKRQVEADLGGFDMEQEWVEEIERENCFKVDTDLGGAPPIQRRAYSLWIVDAANGWMVVDSFEFEEFEHATTMQVMSLSEFKAEPGSANAEAISDEDMVTKRFVAVGTGIIDKDGEDVSSKGRVLLFEVIGIDERSQVATSQVAELSFVYDKEIFHGPVSSLSCLISEGKNRLVIGAGADINVEQWGNDKLTQVGFFRATMHVLDITLFKNFFLLSDAYDSLYFLVWRESDKSLTLLAKDYDPIPVYAAGLMSRGGSLSLVCHDDRQNLQFFQYAPGDAAARGGNKLVSRADFHLGAQTIALQSHFCRSSLLINSATPSSTMSALKQQDTFYGRTDDDQRLGIHFGTTDGGYGTVTPLSEPVYWRLTALQSVMVNAIESDCALSQRAWRMYRRTPRRGGCRNNERKKGVIDGDLAMQFADLELADQEDLASAIGSTVKLVLDNLLELRCSAMVI